MAVETRRCSVAVLLAAMLGITLLGWSVASLNQNLVDPDQHPELFERIAPAGNPEAGVESVQWVAAESSRSMLGLSGTLQLLLVVSSFALYFFGQRATVLRDRRLTIGFCMVILGSVLALILGPGSMESAGAGYLITDVVKALVGLGVLFLLLRGVPPVAAGAPVGLAGVPGAIAPQPAPSPHPSRTLEAVTPAGSGSAPNPDGSAATVESEEDAFHNLLMGAVPLPPSADEILLPHNSENSVTDETNMSCEPLSAPPDAPRFDNVPDMEQYRELYAESVTDPEGFWAAQAERLHWFQPWDKVLEWDFHEAKVKWFAGGKLNVSYNCIDRHVDAGFGNQVAIIWEGDDPGDDRKYTYRELLREVSRFANVLKAKGVKKGDRVCIYLPMIPELAFAMLACTRIGAVHSIVFAGFSAASLRDRILDSECKILITADEGMRGGKAIALKKISDEAIAECPCIETMLLVRRTGRWQADGDGREAWLDDLLASDEISDECEPEPMDAEDPLFILYTSGSTGKPKGVLHTTGGYLTYAAFTHQTVFDHQPGDVFWCSADIGWITGHSYIVYGPLANRATTLMFEGVPSYPDFGRFWDVVDKHQVSIFYTAPTAIRAIAQHGDAPVKARKRTSLRLLGTVGEPINPEVWKWYHEVVGEGRCPIVDTWWQTETGGIMITPLPRATPLKPGSATLPFFGVRPLLVDDEGEEVKGNNASGNLCIAFPWPGMMRTLYGDHQRFVETYFTRFPGRYFTGDGCRRDEDGYYWITGRVDDVINVSGHRLGTAEVESALVSHASVAEAAVVGYPHEIKGTGIHAYCILNEGVTDDEELHRALISHVRTEIGPIATPDRLHFTPGLPKTRSGKIMRRILRKVAAGETEDLGDTSTLADPSVVEVIVKTASA